MKQLRLNVLNDEVNEVTKQYANGMLTIIEFCDFMVNMRVRIGEDVALAGLTDPNTGLPFPTVAETDAFIAEFKRTSTQNNVPEFITNACGL